MEFPVIKAFIGEGKEGKSFGLDKAIDSSLPCIIHDIIFVIRKYQGEVKVKRLGDSQNG